MNSSNSNYFIRSKSAGGQKICLGIRISEYIFCPLIIGMYSRNLLESEAKMKNEERDNERKVGYAIRMQNTAFTRRFVNDGMADGLDEVTIMHGWIMGYLHFNEDKDIYQKTIESQFGICRSSVTSLVKLMEKKGYIKREAVPGDARLKKIVLTPEGRDTAIKVKNTLDDMEMDILKGISKEELDIYFAVADKIMSNLEIQKPSENNK